MNISEKSNVNMQTGEADWGFKVPDTGTYAFQFDEGIDIHEKENEDGVSRSLKFPGHIIDHDEFEGARLTIFAAMDRESGERRVADILVCTDLAGKFEKKFPNEDSLFAPGVINGLKMQVPGKIILLGVEKVTGKKGSKYEGKEMTNITKIGRYKAGATGATGSTGGAKPITAPAPVGDDDAAGW